MSSNDSDETCLCLLRVTINQRCTDTVMLVDLLLPCSAANSQPIWDSCDGKCGYFFTSYVTRVRKTQKHIERQRQEAQRMRDTWMWAWKDFIKKN